MPAPTASTPIDVVDQANVAVGTTPRGHVLDSGVNFRTVHVLVFNRQGELVLQRLAAGRRRHAGRWGSSVAGYLHAGESYEQAARRRLWEELAVEAEVDWHGVVRLQDEQSAKFVGVFTARADHPEVAEPAQIGQLQFVSVRELDLWMADAPQDFTPTFRAVYQDWKGRQHG